MELAGWGRFPRVDCRVLRPRTEPDLVASAKGGGDGTTIARGMGRAYGDSALNPDGTIDMTRFDRMLAFDAQTGVLTAEAGVVLGDVIDVFLPRGWFPPVTPGTKFVTLGGMIAADVHGKNHHKHGSFGRFVEWIDLLGPDGEVRRCSPSENADLFAWTVGGMGLTGIVLRAAVRLLPVESAWIRQRTVAAGSLDQTMAAFDEADDWTYSVAWIDCLARGAALGRSLLMLGEHARRDELDAKRRAEPFRVPRRRRLRVPVDFPGWALNGAAMRAFNALYYRRGARSPPEGLVDWDTFFYPLDAIRDWNRIYGRRGFVQFQCVLPPEFAAAGLRALLQATSVAGRGSFLAVLKRFGDQESRFSFPMKGYTLALDFPANPRALAVVDRLYEIAAGHGGRFYLAKDARLNGKLFERTEARAMDFRSYRAETGADRRFASAQSERLGL